MTVTNAAIKDMPAVTMMGIVKRFPGVLANDHVDFEVKKGEIHTLLGENGAGKSTLMKILSGLYTPDEGDILIHGQRVNFRSPLEAIEHGIGTIYQHFMLVDTFTVAENVTLGIPTPRLSLKLVETEQEIANLAEKFSMQVDPHAHVWQLSVGEQQRVEILKMLYRRTDILILDEPTAALTPPEVKDLFVTLNLMKNEGKTIIFISHKLDEVMEISDSISVLRSGRRVAVFDKTKTNPRELARMMVGREVLIQVQKKVVPIGPTILEVKNLSANKEKGLPALKGVSLDVRAGEILGIAGVAGNGQSELAEVITGLRRSTDGKITLNGEDVTDSSPKRMIDLKVGHIPEDRMGVGLIPNISIADNMILKVYESPMLSDGPFLISQKVQLFAKSLVEQFNISTPGVRTQLRLLSGGNQQKVLLAREINIEPELMVAVHPTRGLDIAATISVRDLLLNQREKGTALLLISEDLDELLQLSDRIAVMFDGKIQGIIPNKDVNMEQIGMMMAGAR